VPWEPALLALGVDRGSAFELRHHTREVPIREPEMLGRMHTDALACDERRGDHRACSQWLESSDGTDLREILGWVRSSRHGSQRRTA